MKEETQADRPQRGTSRASTASKVRDVAATSSRRLAVSLVLAATCFGGCVETQVAVEGEHADESEGAYSEPGDDKLLQGVYDDLLWDMKTLTYCFVTPTLAQMPSSVKKVVSSESQLLARWRGRIQEFVWAINQTWQTVGVIDFRWQEACGEGMVPVTYSEDTATGGWAGLGRDGALNSGIHMDSEYLGDRYPTGLKTSYHTFIVAHEFGHSLGFEHEQNRSDSTCKDSQDFTGAGIRLTGYDPNSIMNYCNSQRTELTSLDREGFKKAYAFLSVVPPPPDPSCPDNNRRCRTMARDGECTRNPGYMLTNCCAACKGSGGTTGGSNTGGTTSGNSTGGTNGGTTGDPLCRDSNSSCSSWARNGECTKNPGYMLTNCCAACNGSGGTTGGSNTGGTTSGSSTGGTTGGTTGDPSCRDSNSSCSLWARNGECTKNPGYMLTNCCASCNGGGDVSCHTLPANDSNYCTSACTCKVGEGDCDSNSQCAAGLICQERGSVDRCEAPSTGGSCNKAVVYRDNGGTAYGECQGDCDSDSDCVSGLRCMQLNTGERVPGCTGTSSNNSDYCVVPACI